MNNRSELRRLVVLIDILSPDRILSSVISIACDSPTHLSIFFHFAFNYPLEEGLDILFGKVVVDSVELLIFLLPLVDH